MNDVPEKRIERIIAASWQAACETVAAICRDTGCALLEISIIETSSQPFEK